MCKKSPGRPGAFRVPQACIKCSALLRAPTRSEHAVARQASQRLQALGDRWVLYGGGHHVRRGPWVPIAPCQRRARQRPVIGLGAAGREHDLRGARRADERGKRFARLPKTALALCR